MDFFNFKNNAYPIDQLEEQICKLHNIMRVSMSNISGYKKVAHKAIDDVRRKDYLRRVCETEAEFKKMWKIECHKKQDKLRSMQEGTWKTSLCRVSFDSTDMNVQKQPISIKKGRFLITIIPNTEKKETTKYVSVVRKGRFLVTKHFVNNKKEVKKPVTTKKGRFLITTH
jgi:hypothetical protein